MARLCRSAVQEPVPARVLGCRVFRGQMGDPVEPGARSNCCATACETRAVRRAKYGVFWSPAGLQTGSHGRSTMRFWLSCPVHILLGSEHVERNQACSVSNSKDSKSVNTANANAVTCISSPRRMRTHDNQTHGGSPWEQFEALPGGPEDAVLRSRTARRFTTLFAQQSTWPCSTGSPIWPRKYAASPDPCGHGVPARS